AARGGRPRSAGAAAAGAARRRDRVVSGAESAAVEPSRGGRQGDPVRQAARPAAADAVAVRVQPDQLPAAAEAESDPARVRRGAGGRERAAAPGRRRPDAADVKLACVVHRGGADIAGGSEGHCRLVAEHLAADHDVTIVTTCARDHVTWANHYAAGESRLGALRIVRFPVERTRDLHRFRDISDRVFGDRASHEEQTEWFRENGPVAPGLLDFLDRRGRELDLVLFWSYRYYDAYFGLPLVADRAILVPTAEEDPLVHVDAVGEFFRRPRGCLFLTPEEEALVGDRMPAAIPRRVIGCGIDPPGAVDRSRL